MAPPLARLANLSFAAGVFPSHYKLGHVIPLLKKLGMPKKDPSSYGPITNLCTFSKILEILVLVRFRPHVQATGNLRFVQSACRPGYSTESALLKVVSDIERAAGNGMCTVLLAMDISVAFDVVNHSILYRRIESDFEVTGTALSWLRSFVCSVTVRIAVGSMMSDTCALSSGVPECSVLGPLLFAMYVSEIDAVIQLHSLTHCCA